VVINLPVTYEKLHNAFMFLVNAKERGENVTAKDYKALSKARKESKLLLIEDNLINQKVVKKILEIQGYTVNVASTGDEGIMLLESKQYDLAIVDLQLPDLNGIEVISRYRNMHAGEIQTPFMILTADVTNEALKQCDEVGVSAYLTKPIRSSQLIETVSRVLGIEQLNQPDNQNQTQGHEKSDSVKNPQVLDYKALRDLERLSKDTNFMRSMVDSFLRDSDALLVMMHKSLEEGDFTQYRDSAHAIADNASGVGARALKAVCNAVSVIEQSEFKTRGIKMLSKISSTYSMTCQALNYYLQQR
jgi:two-component system sensor histidine kinase RpfC